MHRNRRIGVFYPRFLSKSDDSLIIQAIEEFESTLEDIESEVNKENFIGQFPDYKLGVCLYETLSSEFYRISKIDSENALELAQYRLKLWDLVNKYYNGVVTEAYSRDEVFEKFRESLPPKYHDWNKTALNDWIFANYSHRQKRGKPFERPTPEIVREATNLQMIRGILHYAQEVEIIIPIPYKLTSKQVKGLFFLSKRLGIFTTINKLIDSLSIKIVGPEELIGRRDKYGRKIQMLIEQLINRRIQELSIKDWLLNISIPWGRRTRIISFDLTHLPDLPSIGGKTSENMDFDSKTEKHIFHILTALTPWRVAREPDVLIENNQVFVPDFSLQYADLPPIYIEVVGFWTEDYKTKKIEKLTELGKTVSFPLILIVDSSLEFPQIPPFPTFKYISDFRAILVPLNQYLRKKYLIPYEKNRITYLKENITKEIDVVISQTEEGILPELTLLETFSILEKKNLRQVLVGEPQKAYLKGKGWKYVPKIGLLEIGVVKNWRRQIIKKFSEENQSRLDLRELSLIFPNCLPEGLISRLLEYLGFKVQWQQIHTITVVRPSKEREK